jgi:hypothetical protein
LPEEEALRKDPMQVSSPLSSVCPNSTEVVRGTCKTGPDSFGGSKPLSANAFAIYEIFRQSKYKD